MIVFVHPFGLQSTNGGSRIINSLLKDAPFEVLSVCVNKIRPVPWKSGEEVYIADRPYFGKIEHTRFGPHFEGLPPRWAKGVEKKLVTLFREKQVKGVHLLAHGFDFVPAANAARQLGLPIFLSVHDDIRYVLNNPALPKAEEQLRRVWLEAKERFAIVDAMGEEYSKRYGAASYQLVTDGLKKIADSAHQRPNSLRVYFMGLFHFPYTANWKCLATALEKIAVLPASGFEEVSLTARTEGIPEEARSVGLPTMMHPFGGEAEIAADFEKADLLYMPLPFGKEHELFVNFSLSTKMVSYLGSGLPILYHGPASAAAARLLTKHNAAICVSSLDPAEMQAALQKLPEVRTTIVANALELARRDFKSEIIRERFWNAISNAV